VITIPSRTWAISQADLARWAREVILKYSAEDVALFIAKLRRTSGDSKGFEGLKL
jgi:hypothetical protein